MLGMTTQKTTKFRIPSTDEEGAFVAGVLEQVAPKVPTQGRKIALILHGAMGHKDYLYQKRLAHRLPIDSFRIDFRGNHESPGSWRAGAFLNDVQDLELVAGFLKREFGYVIDLIVAHSRGNVAAFRWMCTSSFAKTIRGFVNVAGRYRLELIWSQADMEQMNRKGHYDARPLVARKEAFFRISKEDLEEFSAFDPSLIWDKFPQHTHVLTMHGLADNIVPPYDAVLHARALGARKPGTHNLDYVETADHNFTGLRDEVVATILEWYDHLERGTLTTGVWRTGVRGKL